MPYKQGKRWRGKVTVEGKRYTALKPTKHAAIEWEAKKRKDLKEGKTATDMGLLTFCNKYLDFAKAHFASITWQEKEILTKHMIAHFGDIPISSIDQEAVLSYLDAQAVSRSANAYNKDRKNMLAMWTHGVNFFGLPTNPVAAVRKMRHDRGAQYVPSVADVLKLLAAANKDERILLDCYLNTGARRSEIFRWQWHEDINFERRQVRLGTRKTRDGSMDYEWIPMSETLYQSLYRHWQFRPIKDTPFVFVSTQPGRWYGQPYTQRRKFMSGICRRAGIRPFCFHSLRRFVASYAADVLKVSSKQVQRILRHKSVHTTERYIHNLQEDLRETYEALGDLEQKGTNIGHQKEKESHQK